MTRTGRLGQAACARACPASGATAIAASIVRRVRAVPGMARSVSFDGNLAEDPASVNELLGLDCPYETSRRWLVRSPPWQLTMLWRTLEMPANLSGESPVGLRMQAFAVGG